MDELFIFTYFKLQILNRLLKLIHLKMNKIIAIGLLGNIYFDSRSYNLFNSLKSAGLKPYFFGFDWSGSEFPQNEINEINVKRIKKNVSLLFYLKFFVLLLYKFFKVKADIYVASDFYSLPSAYLSARLKRKKIYYDSREIYPELPAIQNRKWLKKLFYFIENFFIRKVDAVFSTGILDSDYLVKLYKIKQPYLLRNLPPFRTIDSPFDFYNKLELSQTAKIMIYQGLIVKGRGIENCVRTISGLSDFYLVLLGDGEDIEYYRQYAKGSGIAGRILFLGKVKQTELLKYTSGAYAGAALIENTCINNNLASPNKLFEYIMGGVPVIVSDLPQMAEIVEKYKVGAVIANGDPLEAAAVLNSWTKSPELYKKLKCNCLAASKILNWENEFNNVANLFFMNYV